MHMVKLCRLIINCQQLQNDRIKYKTGENENKHKTILEKNENNFLYFFIDGSIIENVGNEK